MLQIDTMKEITKNFLVWVDHKLPQLINSTWVAMEEAFQWMQVHSTLAILLNPRSRVLATVLDQSQWEVEDLICLIREDTNIRNQEDSMKIWKLLQENLIILECQRDLRRSQALLISQLCLKCNKHSKQMTLSARRKHSSLSKLSKNPLTL